MTKNKSLNMQEKKKDEIMKLDVKGLKEYIHYLTKRYYVSYANDNLDEFNNTKNEINEVISYLIDYYPNIYNYLLYSFVLSFNDFLKAICNRDLILLNPLEVVFDLESDNPIDEGIHDLTQEDYLRIAKEQYEMQKEHYRTLEGYDDEGDLE